MICSVFLVTFPHMEKSLSNLAESISASSKTLRNMLPEFNGNEQLFRETQDQMNRSVLRGLAYQIEHEEVFSAEGFVAKCTDYGIEGGFVTAPDGSILYSTDQNIPDSYEASLVSKEPESNLLFYTETLSDGRTIVLAFSSEELEAIIGSSVSWANRILGVRIGKSGFACVVSRDGDIIAHPETRLSSEEHFDLEHPRITAHGISVYMLESPDPIYTYNYSMAGKLIPFRGNYILCGVTFPEYLRDILSTALAFPLLLFLVLYVNIRYLLLLLSGSAAKKTDLRRRLAVSLLISLIITFSASLFLQVVSNAALQMATVDATAEDTADSLNRYDELKKYVTQWFEKEQLKKCRIAADILYNGQEELSRSDVRSISEMLGTVWCFLYNRNGNVILTDSPYDHFSLSRKIDSQSVAFRPLLEGLDHLIQKPMEDDVSGRTMQYIGVSVRNDKDLADGLVQIAVNLPQLKELTDALGIQQEIENISINDSEIAYAIELESKEIRYSTEPEMVGLKVGDDSFEAIGSRFNGYLNFDGSIYISGIRRAEPYLILAMIPKRNVTSDMLLFPLVLSGVLLAAFGVFALIVLRGTKEEDNREETIPAGEKLGLIIQRVFFVVCLLLTLWYFSMRFINLDYPHSGTSLLEFIVHGNWQREPNLFSFTYSLFLAGFVTAGVGLINRILNQLAKNSVPYVQTICYLIKNVLKYLSVLAILYYCLAQFGVDTRTLLASAGILSLIIGLGAKDLVTDILAGLFIIFERTLEVGDFVTVDGFSGFVQEIGLRTTKIALQSNVKILNNADIRKVVNRKGSKQMVVIELGIAPDENLEQVEAVFNRELPSLKESIPGALDAPTYGGLADITDSLCKLRFLVECEASKQVPARAAFLRELKLIAERNSICLRGKQIDVLEIE